MLKKIEIPSVDNEVVVSEYTHTDDEPQDLNQNYKKCLALKQSRESKENIANIENVEPESSNSSREEAPYSSDDSIRDPNYSDDSSSNSSEAESDMSHVTAETIQEKKKTRKRKAEPSTWKKNCAKRLRNSGKSYKTLVKGNEIPERKIQPACNEKCKQNCSRKFTEEERLKIFKNYWDMSDIVKQRTYLLTLMQEVNPKYRYPVQGGHGVRATNHAFYFYKNDQKKRVCKTFFIATLGITNRCIRTVKSKIKNGTLGQDNRGKHANHKQVPEDIKDGIRAHISSIPAIESHYTRAHTEKTFIEGSKTIAQLYRDYKIDCVAQGKPHGNLTMYRNIFNYEYNIAFFVPKKDQCQTCVSFQNSNEEEKKTFEENYKNHIEEKNLSREEKIKDKSKISPFFQVACFDLEATLPTPNGQVSSFYYRSKLSTYNFTVCDITPKGQGAVYCYMWHEAQGKRGAVEIGTCLLNYLKEKSETSDCDDLEITFYSDNCAGQQKNKFVIAAFLYAVANYKIKSITHKYLVTGHTQNEGDNVHSLIEKNIKQALKSGPISTPSQYVGLVQTAKKTGPPFKVIELAHEDFLDLKELAERTCTNFTKNSFGQNFKLSDASVIRVEKENLNSFFYKISFKDINYKSVKINNERRTRTPLNIASLVNYNLQKAYTAALPISKKKYDDLMFLLRTNAINKTHSNFYESLTFCE
ncbi:uncharacterized protein LOC115884790 [Sitophilus oryzae]|uniref:Uncharacterized protein LOC115884790 n=1 Tax=Sitophilus oryzae TaxID=7048 RepID=A0A6J2Y8N8_SITOR|nr:uncharacterized protein LOC115884790 [Sitophilus oryzae]XP_030759331.1 uncharacterized protein LOC115884790 [Sitophilus oryzae]